MDGCDVYLFFGSEQCVSFDVDQTFEVILILF